MKNAPLDADPCAKSASTLPRLTAVDDVAEQDAGEPELHAVVEQPIKVEPGDHEVVPDAGDNGSIWNVVVAPRKEYTVMLGLQAVGRITPRSLDSEVAPSPPVTKLCAVKLESMLCAVTV